MDGWVTSSSVLRALARQISTSQAGTAQAQLAADWDHAARESSRREPPAPLPGYQVIELTITSGSPAAGVRLGAISWPAGSAPVSVLHDHRRRSADPAIMLRPGDRITLLTPALPPQDKPGTPAGKTAGP